MQDDKKNLFWPLVITCVVILMGVAMYKDHLNDKRANRANEQLPQSSGVLEQVREEEAKAEQVRAAREEARLARRRALAETNTSTTCTSTQTVEAIAKATREVERNNRYFPESIKDAKAIASAAEKLGAEPDLPAFPKTLSHMRVEGRTSTVTGETLYRSYQYIDGVCDAEVKTTTVSAPVRFSGYRQIVLLLLHEMTPSESMFGSHYRGHLHLMDGSKVGYVFMGHNDGAHSMSWFLEPKTPKERALVWLARQMNKQVFEKEDKTWEFYGWLAEIAPKLKMPGFVRDELIATIEMVERAAGSDLAGLWLTHKLDGYLPYGTRVEGWFMRRCRAIGNGEITETCESLTLSHRAGLITVTDALGWPLASKRAVGLMAEVEASTLAPEMKAMMLARLASIKKHKATAFAAMPERRYGGDPASADEIGVLDDASDQMVGGRGAKPE